MDDADDLHGEMECMRLRMGEASAKGGQAYSRLLHLAETRDSGQIRRIAQFIASTYNAQAFPFDPFDLRGGTRPPATTCSRVADSQQRGTPTSYRLIPDGEKRVQAVIAEWALKWPAAH